MSKTSRPPIPQFGLPIIETHCHLDYLDAASLEASIAAAQAVGVERFVTIAVSAENQQVVRDISAHYASVWCTQGIHPHEAAQWTDDLGERIKSAVGQSKVVAVGEIGLDYYYDHADRNAQHRAFEAQLAIACENDLPVVIHTREADADTEAILRNALPHLRRRGVIHSFTSGLALAEFCIDGGFYIGFNGITTFKNADNVRAIVAATPLEHIVLETDAPYLTPVPYRGVPNQPKYLPFIAERIAQEKAIALESLLEQAYTNSMRLFFEDL